MASWVTGAGVTPGAADWWERPLTGGARGKRRAVKPVCRLGGRRRKSVTSILLALDGLAWVVMARDETLQTLMGMPESEQADHNEQ